jgi:hypothetical protein
MLNIQINEYLEILIQILNTAYYCFLLYNEIGRKSKHNVFVIIYYYCIRTQEFSCNSINILRENF